MTQTSAPIHRFSTSQPLTGPGHADGYVRPAQATAVAREVSAFLGAAERILLSLLTSSDVRQVPTPGDWAAVAALAENLGLAPRLAGRVAHNPSVPPELRAGWLESRRFTAARNLLFQCEEQKLLRALQHANVQAIPLKGTSLALILGDPAARPVADIDLGVRAADLARAAQVLREAGYAVALPAVLLAHRQFLTGTDEYTSEVKCLRDCSAVRVAVELHWKWLPLPEQEIWASLHLYQPSGVLTLSVELYFLFLCSHAAGGGWAGLRWLCDIAEFLAAHGAHLDPELCTRLACRAGLQRAVGITLALLQELFGFHFTALEPLCDAEAKLAARWFRLRPFQPFVAGTVVGIHRDRLRIQDGPARRLTYLARRLRPTFQEWVDASGELRSAPAAWALRITRLAGMSITAADPSTFSWEIHS